MASKQTPKVRTINKVYTRAEILESLIYELKPFVVSAVGFASAIHFSHAGSGVAKYLSLVLVGCGLFILYTRAKDRGVIQ